MVISSDDLFYKEAHCKYTDVQEYMETDTVLSYPDSNVARGLALYISDFVVGSTASFRVYNPNDFEVVAFFTYDRGGILQGEGVSGIRIKPFKHGKVQENCYDGENFGNCSINQNTVDYKLSEPEVLVPKTFEVTKIKEVCDVPCNGPADCGTGICNIMGYCDTKKNVTCEGGKRPCLDLGCLEPHTKKAGGAYSCIWECESELGENGVCKNPDGVLCSEDVYCYTGICNFAGYCGPFVKCKNEKQTNCKNISCVTPNTKGYKEAYDCVEECTSGSGNGKVCQPHTITKVVIGLVIIILILVAIFIHNKVKGGKIINGATIEGAEIIKIAKEEKAKISEELKKFRDERNQIEAKLNTLRSNFEEKKRRLIEEEEKLNKELKSKELTKEQIKKSTEKLKIIKYEVEEEQQEYLTKKEDSTKELELINRKTDTKYEQLLKDNIEARGLKVYAQYKLEHPWGTNSHDLAIPDWKLLIEVDGSHHKTDKKQIEIDKKRRKNARLKGWRMLRFSNHQVYEKMSIVMERIMRYKPGGPRGAK